MSPGAGAGRSKKKVHHAISVQVIDGSNCPAEEITGVLSIERINQLARGAGADGSDSDADHVSYAVIGRAHHQIWDAVAVQISGARHRPTHVRSALVTYEIVNQRTGGT